jgi:hypothetical protein
MYTGGEILDHVLDRSDDLLKLLVFRRGSCLHDADGEPLQRPFMMHLHLPSSLLRAQRLSLRLARAHACVEALARGFAHVPTVAVARFLPTIAAGATTNAIQGFPITICSTHCTYFTLAKRAHTVGRTTFYFSNAGRLDLCCADPTCVTAHARPGVTAVRA